MPDSGEPAHHTSIQEALSAARKAVDSIDYAHLLKKDGTLKRKGIEAAIRIADSLNEQTAQYLFDPRTAHFMDAPEHIIPTHRHYQSEPHSHSLESEAFIQHIFIDQHLKNKIQLHQPLSPADYKELSTLAHVSHVIAPYVHAALTIKEASATRHDRKFQISRREIKRTVARMAAAGAILYGGHELVGFLDNTAGGQLLVREVKDILGLSEDSIDPTISREDINALEIIIQNSTATPEPVKIAPTQIEPVQSPVPTETPSTPSVLPTASETQENKPEYGSVEFAQFLLASLSNAIENTRSKFDGGTATRSETEAWLAMAEESLKDGRVTIDFAMTDRNNYNDPHDTQRRYVGPGMENVGGLDLLVRIEIDKDRGIRVISYPRDLLIYPLGVSMTGDPYFMDDWQPVPISSYGNAYTWDGSSNGQLMVSQTDGSVSSALDELGFLMQSFTGEAADFQMTVALGAIESLAESILPEKISITFPEKYVISHGPEHRPSIYEGTMDLTPQELIYLMRTRPVDSFTRGQWARQILSDPENLSSIIGALKGIEFDTFENGIRDFWSIGFPENNGDGVQDRRVTFQGNPVWGYLFGQILEEEGAPIDLFRMFVESMLTDANIIWVQQGGYDPHSYADTAVPQLPASTEVPAQTPQESTPTPAVTPLPYRISTSREIQDSEDLQMIDSPWTARELLNTETFQEAVDEIGNRLSLDLTTIPYGVYYNKTTGELVVLEGSRADQMLQN